MDNKEFYISGNTPSSKNSKVWTGKFFIVSKTTAKWIKDTAHEWISQREEFLEELKKTTKPYYIELTFIRKSKHKFDYINIAQAPADEMQKHGWLEDDDADNVKFFFADYKYDKNNPGLIIKILKKEDDIQTQQEASTGV